MAIIKQIKLGPTNIHEIGAKYDEDGSEIKNTYANKLVLENNKLKLKSKSNQDLGAGAEVDFTTATYTSNGLMSSEDKVKLDGFYAATSYATVDYVDTLVSASIDAMVYKGVANSNSDIPTSGVQKGWTYKIGTTGTYKGLSCNAGDLIIYNGTSWQKIESSSSEGVLYKNSPYQDNEMLISDGSAGAIKSVAVNPTITLGAANTNGGQTINATVGGFVGTNPPALATATTGVYGVTKLTNEVAATPAQNLAITPYGVANAIEDALDGLIAAPQPALYTLLPETSAETVGTNTFKWSGNSITISSPDISANSFEFITYAPSAQTTVDEIRALEDAALVEGTQTDGSFTLIAKGIVPTITTHIRVIHKYSSDDTTTAVTSATAQAQRAEAAAARAEAAGIIHRAVTISTLNADVGNTTYPYRYDLSWPGIDSNDWVDVAGINDQAFAVETTTNYIILHFSQTLISPVTAHIFWVATTEYSAS